MGALEAFILSIGLALPPQAARSGLTTGSCLFIFETMLVIIMYGIEFKLVSNRF